MTLDGKIATSSGHSAWVTSPASRARVFDTRARSDAVIVGGQTVRRDNPRLTTRRDSGHTPVRIVMSRTLDLPPVSILSLALCLLLGSLNDRLHILLRSCLPYLLDSISNRQEQIHAANILSSEFQNNLCRHYMCCPESLSALSRAGLWD